MCGILGIVGPEADQVPPEKVSRALDTLSHRGPDGSNSVRLRGALLGQTRLAIIDIAGGAQPMRDEENNSVIVCNGEIYNYKELRADLERKGHVFSTHSDIEIILKCYAEYGKECVMHLDGMFAFVLWDKKKGSAFIGRDRFGKKPLYYTIVNDTFYFASELKALRALGIARSIDRKVLDNYLALMYVPAWKSIYKGIKQVPPAHCGVYENGTLTLSQYWNMPHSPISLSYSDAKEEVRRLLSEAVKKRMLASDVEVGALLSGGVDSTFISLLAQEELSHPLKTFALGYGTHRSELPYAAEAASAIGSEHFTLDAPNASPEALEETIAYFDEPHGDSSDFPQQLISGLAASKVKVALSGDGADELFMGYGWYSRHMHLSYRAHTFEKLFMDPFSGYRKATSIFSVQERTALWGGDAEVNDEMFAPGASYEGCTPLEKINRFDLTTYLPGQLLAKVDRTGMMHGLEVRSPFLDTALAEFVVNLPPEYKMDGKEYKILLKDLLAERMPREFVYRRKQGFGAPITEWLRAPAMRPYVTEMLGNRPRSSNILRVGPIQERLRRFYQCDEDRWSMQLWILLCLEIWLRQLEYASAV